MLGRDSGYQRGGEEHFPNQLTESARRGYPPTFDGAAAWVAENLDYVFSGNCEQHRSARCKQVFEDAKALGTPNNRRASLERWVELVGAPDAEPVQRERAARCLARYVHPSVAPVEGGDWRGWIAERGANLVFVDSAGFWWMRAPAAATGR